MGIDEDELLVQYILDAPLWDQPIYKWHLQRREAQTCPEPRPFIWFLLGGRGSGKTWTSANHIWEFAVNLDRMPRNDVRIALIGETFEDVRLTMVEGETGLLQVIPEELKPTWNRTQGELKVVLPGPPYREIIFKSYTSERPEKLRGPQFHGAWLDEPAKFKDCDADPMGIGTTWNNLFMGLRLGQQPHIVVSGTPTPCPLVKYLVAHPSCVTTKMTTWDNRDNLAQEYVEHLSRLKPGSRAARQEIYAEILLDNPDSLFEQETIDSTRSTPPEDVKLIRVLGYDPSASSAAESDETGIILVAYTPEVKRKYASQGGAPSIVEALHVYVQEDLSGHYTPSEQTKLVMDTVFKHRVDDLVFEQNQGVEFVMMALEQALKDYTGGQYKIRKATRMKRTDYGIIKRFHVTCVIPGGGTHKFTISAIHATKNKKVRAETASIRYDSQQVHHPPDGFLPVCEIDACKTSLESQMTSWNPVESNASPDRLDALVYTLLFIFGDKGVLRGVTQLSGATNPHAAKSITQAASEHGAVKKKRYSSLYSADLMKSGVENGKPPTDPSDLDRSLLSDLPGDSLFALRLFS